MRIKQSKRPTVIKVLQRMKTILRKGWTQHTFARSAKRRNVDWASDKAELFCVLGAAHKAVWDITGNKSDGCYDYVNAALSSCVPHGAVVAFNDTDDRTLKEVIGVVNCALKKVQEVESV